MAWPSKNNPRALRLEALLFFLGISVLFIGLALVTPAQLEELPPLCLWSRILGRPCPACGTTRALCAFFHGEVRQAVSYNWNVLAVAPLLVWLWFQQLVILRQSWSLSRRTSSVLTKTPPPSCD